MSTDDPANRPPLPSAGRPPEHPPSEPGSLELLDMTPPLPSARAQADEIAALLDATPAAIWITHDKDCRHVRGSRVGHEMLRMPLGANLSKTGADPATLAHFVVLSDGRELAPHELPLQRAAREGVELRGFEEEIRFSDGHRIFIYGSALPLRGPGGEPRGAIAAFVDVTPLKRAEQAAREADRRKDEFLAMLSHELRNPLAPILTAAHLMRQRFGAQAPAELSVIERQGQHLVRLVDDLLDVSRVAQGKIELKTACVEIHAVVTKALEATSLLFERKQQSLSVDVPVEGLCVFGDEARLSQVLSNLLSNAARYTPEGGHVWLSARREGDSVTLLVRDDGAGIAPDLLPRIFDSFVQGPQRPDRSEGGLGLGLALAKSLLGLHGGRVTARSDGPGRGAELRVELPLAAGPLAEPPAPSPLPPLAGGGRRVLIVDDNADAAALLSMLLERAGHEVRVANDPPEALAVIEGFSPEVAVLDIGLPVMDGYALGRELRERCSPAPSLLALSGYGQEHDRRRSVEAGFRAHIVKPVDTRRLLELIAEAPRFAEGAQG